MHIFFLCRSNWMVSQDPCDPNGQWYGVSCEFTGATSHINKWEILLLVLLVFKFLSHFIFHCLFHQHIHLTFFFSLFFRFDLSSNHLSGTIPSTLSFLTFLTSLQLSRNNLQSTIPDVFQKLNGIVWNFFFPFYFFGFCFNNPSFFPSFLSLSTFRRIYHWILIIWKEPFPIRYIFFLWTLSNSVIIT